MRRLRQERSLSQRQLAHKLQVSPEYLDRGSDLRESDEHELELAEG